MSKELSFQELNTKKIEIEAKLVVAKMENDYAGRLYQDDLKEELEGIKKQIENYTIIKSVKDDLYIEEQNSTRFSSLPGLPSKKPELIFETKPEDTVENRILTKSKLDSNINPSVNSTKKEELDTEDLVNDFFAEDFFAKLLDPDYNLKKQTNELVKYDQNINKAVESASDYASENSQNFSGEFLSNFGIPNQPLDNIDGLATIERNVDVSEILARVKKQNDNETELMIKGDLKNKIEKQLKDQPNITKSDLLQKFQMLQISKQKYNTKEYKMSLMSLDAEPFAKYLKEYFKTDLKDLDLLQQNTKEQFDQAQREYKAMPTKVNKDNFNNMIKVQEALVAFVNNYSQLSKIVDRKINKKILEAELQIQKLQAAAKEIEL